MIRIESLVRRLLDNRRGHARVKRPYATIIYDEHKREVFRGKVKDLSRGGACIGGLPVNEGVRYGQRVRVELLLLPKDLKKVSERAVTWGWVCRIEEHEDGAAVAVKFERFLADDN